MLKILPGINHYETFSKILFFLSDFLLENFIQTNSSILKKGSRKYF